MINAYNFFSHSDSCYYWYSKYESFMFTGFPGINSLVYPSLDDIYCILWYNIEMCFHVEWPSWEMTSFNHFIFQIPVPQFHFASCYAFPNISSPDEIYCTNWTQKRLSTSMSLQANNMDEEPADWDYWWPRYLGLETLSIGLNVLSVVLSLVVCPKLANVVIICKAITLILMNLMRLSGAYLVSTPLTSNVDENVYKGPQLLLILNSLFFLSFLSICVDYTSLYLLFQFRI